MKKLIILLVISLVMIGTIGCNNKEVEKNMFIEKVKTLEMNEIELNDLDIPYDEFKKNIIGIFTPKSEKYYLKKTGEHYFRTSNGENIYMKELQNISEKELEEYQAMKYGDLISSDSQKVEFNIEISNANYEGTFDGEKRVYSKTTRTVYFKDQDPFKSLVYKIYDFKKADDEWKISHIKKSYPQIDRMTGKVSEEVLSNTAFTPENNNKIKYVESISITAKSQ